MTTSDIWRSVLRSRMSASRSVVLGSSAMVALSTNCATESLNGAESRRPILSVLMPLGDDASAVGQSVRWRAPSTAGGRCDGTGDGDADPRPTGMNPEGRAGGGGVEPGFPDLRGAAFEVPVREGLPGSGSR